VQIFVRQVGERQVAAATCGTPG